MVTLTRLLWEEPKIRLLVRAIHILARIAVIAMLSWVPTSLLDVRLAAAQIESIAFEFRTALEPYGEFRHVARWGEVWVPNDVAPNWRPYTIGCWVYSDDYGWYWASDQAEAPREWIVFHYGRWVWVDDIGWVWLPGREWGPAWVDWRHGARYVGWAPLPPDQTLVEVRDDPHFWIFVPPRALGKADSAICHLVDEANAARQSSHSTLAIPRGVGR